MISTTEQRRPVIACIADSASGRAVARLAAALARRLDARLLLATVAQPSGDLGARSVLVSTARALDPAAELHVAVGEPAERLLELAEREAARLVVVSVPAGSPPRRLGNVYLALASAAPCPVMLVPARVAGRSSA